MVPPLVSSPVGSIRVSPNLSGYSTSHSNVVQFLAVYHVLSFECHKNEPLEISFRCQDLVKDVNPANARYRMIRITLDEPNY